MGKLVSSKESHSYSVWCVCGDFNTVTASCERKSSKTKIKAQMDHRRWCKISILSCKFQSRRRINQLLAINKDGQLIERVLEIKSETKRYFQERFHEPNYNTKDSLWWRDILSIGDLFVWWGEHGFLAILTTYLEMET